MKPNKIKAGDVFAANNGGSATVIEYRGCNKVLIKHNDEKQYQAVVRAGQLRGGRVMNPYARAIWGVGFVGVGEFKARVGGKTTPPYDSWASMLQRAYDPKFHATNPAYCDVSVSKEWHDFQCFAAWWHNEPNSGRKGFDLDKDLRIGGNLEYSPDASSFVPLQINRLLNDNTSARGLLPQGVSAHGKGFQAILSVNGKCMSLGTHATPRQAHEAYKIAKEKNVRRMAEDCKDYLHPEVYSYLKSWTIA